MILLAKLMLLELAIPSHRNVMILKLDGIGQKLQELVEMLKIS